MWQFCHSPNEIVERTLPFIDNLVVDDRNGFLWDRRDKTTRETLDESAPHFIKFIEPTIDIKRAILIMTNDVIDNVIDKSSSCLVTIHLNLNVLSKLSFYLE